MAAPTGAAVIERKRNAGEVVPYGCGGGWGEGRVKTIPYTGARMVTVGSSRWCAQGYTHLRCWQWHSGIGILDVKNSGRRNLRPR